MKYFAYILLGFLGGWLMGILIIFLFIFGGAADIPSIPVGFLELCVGSGFGGILGRLISKKDLGAIVGGGIVVLFIIIRGNIIYYS